ncbi:hypothetical protein THAOC_29488, partial [Thalassiosira oceanica]
MPSSSIQYPRSSSERLSDDTSNSASVGARASSHSVKCNPVQVLGAVSPAREQAVYEQRP